MYEKNISDWNIWEYDGIVDKKNFMQNGFSMSIGTWSNYNLSIVDCLAVLELHNKNKTDGFIKILKERNKKDKWFFNNDKNKHINFIKKWGINPYHFVNIDSFIESETDFLTEQNELREDDYISEDKIKEHIDSEENHKRLIKAIEESKSIKNLYYKVLEIKADIREEIQGDIYNFIVYDYIES